MKSLIEVNREKVFGKYMGGVRWRLITIATGG